MNNLWILLGILLLLSPLILPILFGRSRREARSKAPREDGEELEFFLAPSMRLMVNLVLAALFAFTILIALAAPREDGSMYALLIPLAVLVSVLLVRPVPVVVDREGIRQSRWLLPDKQIAWKDIESVAYGPNTGTTYVRSRRGGPKIRFSVFLVGRKRFKHEIRLHTRAADLLENSDDG
jgi:uncharacterized Tic20 family protein